MGRLVDCQMALVPWGQKIRFRRAKVGLLRKGNGLYIAVFSKQINYGVNKLQINPDYVEVLASCIRFKDIENDLFISDILDKQKYITMVREIKIYLKRDNLMRNGKKDAFDKFLSSIPTYNDIPTKDLSFAPFSARVMLHRPSENETDNTCGNNLEKLHNHHAGYSPNVTTPTDMKARHYQQLSNKLLRSIKISGMVRPPKEIWLRTTLQELTLTECNLTSVPQELMTFSSTLTSLNLSNNRIARLPRAFCCKMNSLISLNLSNNQIETLPIEIKFFRNLIGLDVSKNRLRMLPSTFSDLKNLRFLNVANNNLSQLPAFKRGEITLSELDVSSNPLDGALYENSTFEVYPSGSDGSYEEDLFCPLTSTSISKKRHFPTLYEASMLKIVRCDRLLKLASEKSLPRTIVSTMQRDIFKCFCCGQMNILPAYNSTDRLDYLESVSSVISTMGQNLGMTFMKLLCSGCFDNMSS